MAIAKKTLLGAKIRRLRAARDMAQGEMARTLGISASYLNLIEHDQRPVTVGLLLKLGQTLGVDLQSLSDDDERRHALALREVFADGTLASHEVPAAEIEALARHAPAAARAIIDLYRAYRGAREDALALGIGLPGGRREGVGGRNAPRRRLLLPTEEARDFFHDRTNHFPELEAAAEKLWVDAGLDAADPLRGLSGHLAARHRIAVAIEPSDAMGGALRRFDPASARLILSDALPRSSHKFQVAYQLALLEGAPAMDAILHAADLSSPETTTLCRVGLANYFAGAAMMPYAPFLAAAKAARYDAEVLARRFDASFEQVCHRLSTLQRPGARGVPFYLVRVDNAGNISKRFSAAGFHFTRFGGSCPRWIVHDCFATPGRIRTQIARLPDGATFFCLARTLDRPGAGFHEPRTSLAIGLGCEIAHARALVYADGYDLEHLDGDGTSVPVTEIGVGCQLCERADCRQRAFPPLNHRLALDEKVRGASPYPFRPAG